MFLVTVGLNHKTAPVEIREKLAFTENQLPEALQKLKDYAAIDGCVLLSTCNRTEIYAACTDLTQGLKSIKSFLMECLHEEECEIDNFLYIHTLYDCVHHLFRVASGLDSMILGETQILGQVRQAYQIASAAESTNKIINTLFHKAIAVGKRVRTETEIDKNAVSISYAAVELARQQFCSLAGKAILVIGAGKMSELTAKHLVASGVNSVLVSNRSFDKAVELAEKFGGRAVRFNQLQECLVAADIVISATAARHAIITTETMNIVMQKRQERPIFLIDIAVPRDIDPEVATLKGVTLFDIDDLQNVVDRNLQVRKKEAVKAQKIVDEEIREFFSWLNTQFVVPTIVALKQLGEEIKQRELEKAFNKLGEISERERNIIQALAHSIVNSLLHRPIVNLKNYAQTSHGHLYTEILQNLFDLQVEGQRIKHVKPEAAEEVEELV